MSAVRSKPGLRGAQPDHRVLEAANATFRSFHYLRHNQRRLEHLASLDLDLAGRTVLELGAGVGDHTTFFLDRGCTVLSVEPRAENCQLFTAAMQAHAKTGYSRVARARLVQCDVGSMDRYITETFDIVCAYGLLYHLAEPQAALEAMARRCGDLLLLETCVSFGANEAINPEPEPQSSASQSFQGMGCRPTRPWVFSQLTGLFAYVYATKTQPAHEEFPLDWTTPPPGGGLRRAVFVASRRPLSKPLLLDHLPDRQTAT
jgi:SAM-dependent methyltransferase